MPKSDKNRNGRHEAAFASWIRRNGYGPSEAVELFIEQSDYVRDEFSLLVSAEKENATGLLRKFCSSAAANDFTMQFPKVYLCQDKNGRRLRYTVTLTIGEQRADWIGRVWAGSEYLGEITGSGGGPKANYLTLAKMHIESQIDCHDAIIKRPLPDFW